MIRLRGEPLLNEAGIAVLRGNLAPAGAIIKPAAASAHLIHHRGRALLVDSIEDFHVRIDDPELDVDADTVLVLRGCGPRGYLGMPGSLEHAPAEETARTGRPRHGAYLRRPDERKRDSLQLAGWAREAAPSDELRRWFGHDPSRWEEFRRRYVEELDANPAAWRPLLDSAHDGNLLLLYAARDRDRNNAVVLRDYLLAKLSRTGADEGDTDSSG